MHRTATQTTPARRPRRVRLRRRPASAAADGVFKLADGTDLQIRPIEARDRGALASAFSQLSEESRYLRFFSAVPELSPRTLDYLTVVDHRDHEALVAIDPVSRDGVGVARYVRTGPSVAEPAVVVADAWQHRGVARLLLAELARRARGVGIRTFDASILASNARALALFGGLGAARTRQEGAEVRMIVDLTGAAPRELSAGWREMRQNPRA